MDLNNSHTRVSGYGTVYRMNYDGVKTLGNFVDCSVDGTVPCVDARLVDSRYILKRYGHTFLHHYNLYLYSMNF